MTNEELVARFSEMQEKLERLEGENGTLKQEMESLSRAGAPGVSHTLDSAHGSRLSGLQAARSVTIATRPVQDDPGRYPTAVFKETRISKENYD